MGSPSKLKLKSYNKRLQDFTPIASLDISLLYVWI